MAELVDAPDSKSGFFGSGGSIPPLGTILRSKHSLESQAVTSKSVRRSSKSPTEFENAAWQASERVSNQYQLLGKEGELLIRSTELTAESLGSRAKTN